MCHREMCCVVHHSNYAMKEALIMGFYRPSWMLWGVRSTTSLCVCHFMALLSGWHRVGELMPQLSQGL